MKKGLSELLQNSLPRVSPPSNLEGKILICIHTKEKRQARVRFGFLSTLSLASFAGIIPLTISLFHSIASSGFYQYLSLIYSENVGIASVWKELTLSLFDSLPVVGIIAFLTTMGILIWSLAQATKKARQVFLTV